MQLRTNHQFSWFEMFLSKIVFLKKGIEISKK